MKENYKWREIEKHYKVEKIRCNSRQRFNPSMHNVVKMAKDTLKFFLCSHRKINKGSCFFYRTELFIFYEQHLLL